MARVVVDIGADTASYVEQVKKIPGITQKELDKISAQYRQGLIKDAIKGLGTVGNAAEDASEQAAKAAEKAAKAAQKIEKEQKAAADAITKAQGEFRNQLLDLGELVGVPADKIKKLGAGLGALASPAGIAAVAIGAVAAASVGIAAGIVSAVSAADDLARQLKEIKGLSKLEGFGVSAADLKAIDEANAALEAISVIGKRAIVTLGTEFAPAVEAVAVELVKFGLIALDAFNNFADGGNVLKSLASFMVERLTKSILSPIDSLVQLTSVMADVADVAGADGLAGQLRKVDTSYQAMVDRFSDGAVDMLGVGFERLSGTTSDYDARARALVGTMEKHAASTRNAAENAKALADAEREAERAAEEHKRTVEGLTAEYQRVKDAQDDAARGSVARTERELAALEDLRTRLEAEGMKTAEVEQVIGERKRQIQAAYVAGVIAEEQKLEAERQKAHDAEIARITAQRDARLSAAYAATGQIINATQALADQETQIRVDAAKSIEEQLTDSEANLTAAKRQELQDRLAAEKKAVKRGFALSKALSIAEIAISTVQASMAAYAQGMKLGGPIAAAALVAATLGVGALQTAVVARQKPPAHRGLVPVSGAAADEGVTMLTAGEAVLSPRGVEAAGGAEGVSALNAGRSGSGGATTVNLNLGLRTLDTVTATAAKSPGATRQVMRSGTPVGQRRNRRGN